MMSLKPKKSLLFVLPLIIIVVILITPSFSDLLQGASQSTHPYLSPRLFTENQNDILINFIPLREKLRDFVKSENDKIGFNFEYLPTGISIGIHDKKEHVFASLFKVPLVMAYYLQTNAENTLFNQTFTLKEDQLDENYGELWRRGVGTQLTATEIIKEMLINSDNTAANVLADYIKPEYMQEVFNGLDISIARDDNKQQTITAKSYASIFKSLYLSAILPYDQSQEILAILNQSTDTHALRREIPHEIPVAHKFGVYKDNLYWDCGIIYVPKRPYSLCVFSEEYSDAAKTKIGTLSKMIYDYVTTTNQK